MPTDLKKVWKLKYLFESIIGLSFRTLWLIFGDKTRVGYLYKAITVMMTTMTIMIIMLMMMVIITMVMVEVQTTKETNHCNQVSAYKPLVILACFYYTFNREKMTHDRVDPSLYYQR